MYSKINKFIATCFILVNLFSVKAYAFGIPSYKPFPSTTQDIINNEIYYNTFDDKGITHSEPNTESENGSISVESGSVISSNNSSFISNFSVVFSPNFVFIVLFIIGNGVLVSFLIGKFAYRDA